MCIGRKIGIGSDPVVSAVRLEKQLNDPSLSRIASIADVEPACSPFHDNFEIMVFRGLPDPTYAFIRIQFPPDASTEVILEVQPVEPLRHAPSKPLPAVDLGIE